MKKNDCLNKTDINSVFENIGTKTLDRPLKTSKMPSIPRETKIQVFFVLARIPYPGEDQTQNSTDKPRDLFWDKAESDDPSILNQTPYQLIDALVNFYDFFIKQRQEIYSSVIMDSAQLPELVEKDKFISENIIKLLENFQERINKTNDIDILKYINNAIYGLVNSNLNVNEQKLLYLLSLSLIRRQSSIFHENITTM